MYWSQRAKAIWLEKGDKNTKVFHAKASSKRKNNTIFGEEDSNGTWHTNDLMVEKIILDYFHDIFFSSGPSISDIESVIESVPTSVSNEMNEFLCSPYTEIEIRDALWQFHPSKSPSPNGFSSFFYHKYWEAVKDSFVPKCLVVLNYNVSAYDINKNPYCPYSESEEPKICVTI